MVVKEDQHRIVFPSHPPKMLLVLVIIIFLISLDMSMVCMDCYSGKKFVSMEGCF